VRERQSLPKLTFNLSMFAAECCVAMGVFGVLLGGADLTHPRAWVAALAGAAAADVLSIGCVALAIRWHGAEADPGQLLLAGGVTAVTNTSLALVAGLLLSGNPLSLALLALLAALIMLAYRSFASVSQRYSSLQQLYDFTTVVGGTRSAEAVLEAMLSHARRVLRAETAEITLFAADGTSPHRLVATDGEPLASAPPASAALEEMLEDSVLRLRRALVIPRTARDPHLRRVLEHLDAKDAMVAPLMGAGGVVGVIVVLNRLGDISTFDTEDGRLFETLSNHASVAFDNGRLIQRLEHEVQDREFQALHDGLTSLPNRTHFFRAVTEAITNNDAPCLAVMLMDLDRFKEVNDTLGHHNGDLLLQEVAQRLTTSDLGAAIARLGGDEFAVLLPVSGGAEAQRAAQQIRTRLAAPMQLDEMALEVGASIGIALWPAHGSDAPSLLKCADVAMYTAKGSSSGIAIYQTEHDEHSVRRLALGSEMRNAIDERNIVVYYQPKVSLLDGEIKGVEALVRWIHPTHGFLSPNEFIPVAERTGLVGPLTRFVLQEALAQCAAWKGDGLSVTMAVNLAVRSLLDPDLPDEIDGLLAGAGLAPGRLTLELTETSVMAEPLRTVKVLERLAERGIQLSVDDFGTGYSSLSYLQRLPVQEVKIDRSFVSSMDASPADATIVQSIVDLGHNLGLRVVAEGVEDAATWSRLATMGCDLAQGYYLSRPVPGATLARWAQDRREAAHPAVLLRAV
jgi:diguanylate cyclase (GGDEF)-like protein